MVRRFSRRQQWWHERLTVGLAILTFVYGAYVITVEASRYPLLARAAAVGERICTFAADGTLAQFVPGSQVPGTRPLKQDVAYGLRNLSDKLRTSCYYAAREGGYNDVGCCGTYTLTIADVPVAPLVNGPSAETRTLIRLELYHHVVLSRPYDRLDALLGFSVQKPEFSIWIFGEDEDGYPTALREAEPLQISGPGPQSWRRADESTHGGQVRECALPPCDALSNVLAR